MESYSCIVRLATLSVTPTTIMTKHIISKLYVNKEMKGGNRSRILGIIWALFRRIYKTREHISKNVRFPS
jgi:hypothetical protein